MPHDLDAESHDIVIPTALPAAHVLVSASFVETLSTLEIQVQTLKITSAEDAQAAVEMQRRLTKAGTALESARNDILPNYDTASFDYNFTTIYQENAFVGNDRIADNNLLTLGLSSRLLDPASGSQAAQFGIANRLRFSSQQVTLPGQAAVPSGWSDILVGGIVNWDPRWSARAVVQFDAKTASSVRTTVGGTYNPGNYRVFNAAYRLQAGTSESLDVSWQWPINDLWGDRGQELGAGKGQGPGRWYTVGRMSYSLMNRQLTDGLLGFEYDAGCWLTRIVVTRLQTSSTTANTSVTMQLELVGFSRLGTSPLKTLRDQVSRYQYLRDQSTPPPSRFSNYE